MLILNIAHNRLIRAKLMIYMIGDLWLIESQPGPGYESKK